MKKFYEALEFNKILHMLEEHALSNKAKERIRNLEPYLSEAEVSRHTGETTEARLIMEHYGTPPLSGMYELDKSLALLGKGTILLPEQLESIAQFLTACRRMKAYLKKAEATFTSVASYGNSMYALEEVEGEINRSIRGSQVDDKASPALADIRRKIANIDIQAKSKLDSLLRNNKNWFSESFVSIRNGHYTLPVKKEYKNQVKGAVIDVSQSGNTYFIEPLAVRKLQEELSLLFIEEENEIKRILYMLTTMVEENLPYISINIEAMETLDFIFAKAKLSIAMKAVPLPVSAERKIEIKGGRHPLLKADAVVPLDFRIGGDIRGVVITGPNTGGKTVALKTIGLLSMMAQSGLHVPAEAGCFTMNNYVLCDIGDGQSITENLSTFSSHMTNIIKILQLADDQSLVLLDELGSGTDPAEGMGLAIAILEELAAKNCLFVATTHYPEIKDFAKATPGLINARMAFDRQSLLPLYRLEMGEAGESCALYIAMRLGLPQRLIERASLAAYGNRTGKSGEMSGIAASIPTGDAAGTTGFRLASGTTDCLKNMPADDTPLFAKGKVATEITESIKSTPASGITGHVNNMAATDMTESSKGISSDSMNPHEKSTTSVNITEHAKTMPATGMIKDARNTSAIGVKSNTISTAPANATEQAKNMPAADITEDAKSTYAIGIMSNAESTPLANATENIKGMAVSDSLQGNLASTSQSMGFEVQPGKRIKWKEEGKISGSSPGMSFNVGDSVMVCPQKLIGIVYQKANDKGEVGVQIKGKKLLVNHKRLKLHVASKELYPENYDFSIIFDTADNRKKRRSMERKHDPGLIIEIDEGKGI